MWSQGPKPKRSSAMRIDAGASAAPPRPRSVPDMKEESRPNSDLRHREEHSLDPAESGPTARVAKVGIAHLSAIPAGTPSDILHMQHPVDWAGS